MNNAEYNAMTVFIAEIRKRYEQHLKDELHNKLKDWMKSPIQVPFINYRHQQTCEITEVTNGFEESLD